MVRNTWEKRELVILEAIANYEDETGDSVPNLKRLVELSGLDAKTCSVGLKALITAQPPLVAATDASTFGGWDVLEIDLLERGRRAVGQWPNENPANELLELLRERVESAATDEERGRWKTALDVLKALPGKALTEVTIALIKREAGL